MVVQNPHPCKLLTMLLKLQAANLPCDAQLSACTRLNTHALLSLVSRSREMCPRAQQLLTPAEPDSQDPPPLSPPHDLRVATMLPRHKYCAILTIGLKRMLSYLSLSCFHLACVASFLPPFNRWQRLSCLRDEMSQPLGKMETKEKAAGGVVKLH